MTNTTGTLHDMNDRELDALQRGLDQLHSIQVEPKKRLNRPRSEVPQCKHKLTYWDESKLKLGVFVMFQRKRVWCGSTYYEDRAEGMQERKLSELIAKEAVKGKWIEKISLHMQTIKLFM